MSLADDREAGTLAAAVELIDWYDATREIEVPFCILKKACKVEALGLGSIEQLEYALALFIVVAARIASQERWPGSTDASSAFHRPYW